MTGDKSVSTPAVGGSSGSRLRFVTVRLFLQEPKAVVGLAVIGLFLLVAIFGPALSPYSPHAIVGLPWQRPSAGHWLGTTDQGQDVFSQWVYGTRTSMLVGLASGFVSTVIAVLIGMFAGYKGGVVDTVLNTITNIILVLPGFPLILVLASYVTKTGPGVITLIIGLTSWAGAARTKRAQAMTFRKRDFIVAAKLSGASDIRILLLEVMPNMLSFVFNNFIGAALGGILAEAGLEFVGLGSPMTPSWGNMLNWADHGAALLNGGWWWFAPPGVSIALVGFGFTLVNFAIDEVTNPRLRKPYKQRLRKSRLTPSSLEASVAAGGEGGRT